MALLGINEARNSLSVAGNNYARLQKEIDKYNKLFQTYVHASPETQIRAASVMRQALNEYNSLKAQQENNALKIYEAQNWVNYYNNKPVTTQTAPIVNQTSNVEAPQLNLPQVDIDTGTYEEKPIVQETPTANVTLPASINAVNVAAVQSANNDTTLNSKAQAEIQKVKANLGNKNKIKTNTIIPKAVQSQIARFKNTSIRPATTQWTANINFNRSGAGNVAGINSGSSLVNGLNYR